MSDIAASAGISIGSLYQYFPEKAAIIRTLAERYNAECRGCIQDSLDGVQDAAGLLKAFTRLIEEFHALVSAEPVMRDIWSGMQSDRQLLSLQLAESRLSGKMLAKAMQRAHPEAVASALDETAFLIWELGETTVRLAITVAPAEGKDLVQAFIRIALRELADPLRSVNAELGMEKRLPS